MRKEIFFIVEHSAEEQTSLQSFSKQFKRTKHASFNDGYIYLKVD